MCDLICGCKTWSRGRRLSVMQPESCAEYDQAGEQQTPEDTSDTHSSRPLYDRTSLPLSTPALILVKMSPSYALLW